MTHMVAHFAVQAGHANGRVIGSGTILDTARFRTLLARHLGVSSHSVHAHVLGEHGDSEVLHWSGANVSNIGLKSIAEQLGRPVTPEVVRKIDDNVRRAAYHIIAGKGATWYGIGAAMARIARAIIGDEHCVLTVSAPLAEVEGVENITPVASPHYICKGAGEVLRPVLDSQEKGALRSSADILKSALNTVGF